VGFHTPFDKYTMRNEGEPEHPDAPLQNHPRGLSGRPGVSGVSRRSFLATNSSAETLNDKNFLLTADALFQETSIDCPRSNDLYGPRHFYIYTSRFPAMIAGDMEA
jgi:hypothetical protein